MKKLTIRSLILAALLFSLVGLSSRSALAQSMGNRISFGFDGGGNKYYGNFNDNQFWFSGDAFIRWNIIDYLSLVASFNSGQLRYKGERGKHPWESDLFWTLGSWRRYWLLSHWDQPCRPPVSREVLNIIRHNGWDFMLSFQPFPGQKFCPYVIGGIELLNFEPRNKDQYFPLPNNQAGVYKKNTKGR